MAKKLIVALVFLLIHTIGLSQGNKVSLKDRLVLAESEIPGLSEPVDISVNGMVLKELLYSIGASVKMNILADDGLTQKVTGTFVKVKMTDLLLYLAETYSLDMKQTGGILHFFPRAKTVERHTLLMSVDSSGRITMDLRRDTLGHILKALSDLTGINFLYDNELYSSPVSCFMKEGTTQSAIDAISTAAGLKADMLDSARYRFTKRNISNTPFTNVPAAATTTTVKDQYPGGNVSVKRKQEFILVEAENSSVSTVVIQAALELGIPYILLSEMKGNVTVKGQFPSFESILDHIFTNTPYGYRKTDELYLIGSRNDESLRQTAFFTFRHRNLEGVFEQIPAELRKPLDIKPFPELNGFIISGSVPASNELISFLMMLDKKVPLIDIEVYITDIRDSKQVSTGIEASLTNEPVSTAGSVYPYGDIKLNSSTVNEIMSGITRLGLISLGRVGPAFFLKLKLLEEQGLLKIRSTPRLATLNGHEAKMSIGRTEYYLETQNNIIGSQNPQNVISQQYKSVTADLSLILKPTVSDNEEITMSVQVIQSNFTERISPSAPPGTISRDFQSLLRVRNGEMVVLGGLEEDTRYGSSKGIPVLSRIPVLKWLFSSRDQGKSKSRLTIFIRPTVTYT